MHRGVGSRDRRVRPLRPAPLEDGQRLAPRGPDRRLRALGLGSFYHYSGQTRTYRVDLTLPATGTIAGIVHGAARSATVWPSGFPYSYLRSTTTEEDGSFEIAHVWPAAGSVAAEDAGGIPTGPVPATVVAGQETWVELWTLPAATLELSLVDESGAPLVGAVEVQAPEAPSPSSPWESWSRSVDVTDNPTTVPVPAGIFRAVSGDRPSPGAADGVLEADETGAVVLQRGSHVEKPLRLEGPDGTYVTDPWEWCEDPCGRVISSSVEGSEEYPPFVRPELDGRAFRSLLTSGSGARIRQQLYVPASGRFARTLTVVTNPTATPLSLRVYSSVRFPSAYGADLVDEARPDGTFDADDTWAAYSVEGASVGWTTGGLLRPSWASLEEGGEGGVAWSWEHTLELPPGESRAFLTFSVHRRDDDQAALVDTLRALAALTEPGALDGLTLAEREAIANFEVRPLGDIEGTVTDQGLPVEGARVGVFDPQGALLAEDTTDAAGAFTFPALDPGLHSVVAVDPASGRPGRLVVDVAAGPPTPAEVTIAAASALGGVHVVGTIEGLGPALGAVVELWADGYSPVWAPSAVLDANGEATFAGVPPGPVEVRWSAPSAGDPVAVVVSAGVIETVALTATQPPVFPPVDLTGGDGIPYTVRRVRPGVPRPGVPALLRHPGVLRGRGRGAVGGVPRVRQRDRAQRRARGVAGAPHPRGRGPGGHPSRVRAPLRPLRPHTGPRAQPRAERRELLPGALR